MSAIKKIDGTTAAVKRPFDVLTKEEIVHAVEKSGCKMLSGLYLHGMTRDEIEKHLLEAKCPVIKSLMGK